MPTQSPHIIWNLEVKEDWNQARTGQLPRIYKMDNEKMVSSNDLSFVYESSPQTFAESFTSYGTPVYQSFSKSPLFQELFPSSSPREKELLTSHSSPWHSPQTQDNLSSNTFSHISNINPIEIRSPLPKACQHSNKSPVAISRHQAWNNTSFLDHSLSKNVIWVNSDEVKDFHQSSSCSLPPKIQVKVKRYCKSTITGKKEFACYDYYDIGEDELYWDNLEEWKVAHIANPRNMSSSPSNLAWHLGYGAYDSYFDAQCKADKNNKYLQIANHKKQKKAEQFVERNYGCEIASDLMS
ncbi:hypothetical protein NEOLI_005325 [Neolecta irregularis DAH-3]|uniref:Uncharacterized protein n=1 Tax=Neolecta irregularis (strain DAH-3) TaxID=1198029 RepID=A0A1U7LUZ9_NEOID|nr:hypothetical protein NEOLI_005325 [Neolecta irregularis DAH-3]|eukprot:OLL26372.1 hypothetical protein NEOLI_005325 [Neolecta irregularis DAH-3]